VLSVTYVPAGSPAPSTLPTVSISAPPTNVPQMENSGKITFTLTLSQAATQDVTVSYSTADGTAKAGSDYTATTGTVTFHAGETVKQFDVSLINDTTAERVENVTAQITSAAGAAIATATADGHITDDDVVVAPFAPLNATIVHSYDLSNGSVYLDGSGGTYGISDPSGIAWIPSLNQFFIADSEHDESPFYSSINMFALGSDGSYIRNYNLEGYTKEPTGLAYDPNNGYLYVSDDSKAGVFWVDPLNPTVKLGFFDTKLLGYQDTEDLKIDPLTGHIHEVDGELMQLIELTTTGQFVDSVPLPSIMKDAEALAYDPKHDVYFVSSGHETNHNIYVIDPLGDLLATISVLSPYSGVKVKGLELAPSSDPNDGNQLSLYVADYGSDQVNDGKLWEIHLGPDWTFG
jgi:Calx-beta domain